MSLDVYLEVDEAIVISKSEGKIFIRENGKTKEISIEEWQKQNPGREPIILKSKESETNQVYHSNITHNLNTMADACGVYDIVWRPDENGLRYAEQLIEPLETGIANLKSTPMHFKQFNPDNGWGDYDGLVKFLEDYLAACRKYPKAKIRACR